MKREELKAMLRASYKKQYNNMYGKLDKNDGFSVGEGENKLINFREILYLQLDVEDVKILDIYFDTELNVTKKIEKAMTSKTTFYRKVNKILDSLIEYYDTFKEIFN